MIADLGLRFLLGGLIVSAFALVGDVLRPKHFAGIFSAAPSVALASLGLAFAKHGSEYAGVEARSMLAGAVALTLASVLVARLLLAHRGPSWLIAGGAWVVWLAVALGAWAVWLRPAAGA